MKKLSKLLTLSIILLSLASCNKDEDCLTQAYKVWVGESTSFESKSMSTQIPNVLSEDLFINGDAFSSGGINTNGHSLEITGDLTINGGLNMASTSTITVYGTITVNGGVNLNQGVIWCDVADINGGVNGSGFINYCTSYDVSGNINNNQSTPVLQNNCGTLSNDNDPDYVLEVVPCNYVGQTIDGYKYINAN